MQYLKNLTNAMYYNHLVQQRMTLKDYVKAIGVGITTAVVLSTIMVPAYKVGIASMPKPLDLAFAQLLLGEVPFLVGVLFHIAYLTFWSVVYIAVFNRQTFRNAVWLALGLWMAVLVFFFPMVGLGFCGLSASPKLIIASLVPHALFAIILWGICRWAFQDIDQDY